MKLLRIALVTLILGVFSVAAQETLDYSDETLSFSYETDIFAEVSASVIEAIPYEENMPIWASNPAYVEYSFSGYAGLEADVFFHNPRILILNTGEFEDYTDRDPAFPWGYGVELEKLQALLEDEELDLSQFTVPDTNSDPDITLPFLPPFGAAQVFRAQPEVIEFEGGKGIRYLTYFSQSVNPISDQEIFYTFQGLTDSGMVYISAIFPVQTGLFPTALDFSEVDYEAFAANYTSYLEESNAALNEQDAELFNPNLEHLDALIESIQFAGN